MYSSGPLSQNISINGGQDRYTDPNTNSSHGTSQLSIPNVPREVHTLNDAILAAATALAKTKTGRRRIVYVISDGKEYGSKAKYSEVMKYLKTNKIAVYGTLVGDSALPVIGLSGPDASAADDAGQHPAGLCEGDGRKLRWGVPAEGHREELCEDRHRGSDAVHDWLLHA